MNKEKKLEVLLSLYNNVLTDIAFYQNQGDNTDIKDVLPIAIIPMLEIFDVNTFIVSIACLFVPLIQCLSLQRGLQAHKFVAMLRGYAATIEESINDIIEENHFIYNSKLIDKYIASDKIVENKGIKTTWFTMGLLHYAVLAVCFGFFIYFNLGQPWWLFIIVAVWFIFLAIIITIFCKKFAKKERDRFGSKEFAKEMIEKKTASENETSNLDLDNSPQ